jgi:hypothetical protein
MLHGPQHSIADPAFPILSSRPSVCAGVLAEAVEESRECK